ncbi:hypothetical protein ACFLUX_02620 [Chloroflexota bacterium]
MLDLKNTKVLPLSEKQFAEEVKEATEVPGSTATGNEKIAILKDEIYRKGKESCEVEAVGVELAIKNVSDLTIATAVFEAVFYDKEGNILDTVEHKEIELQPYMRSRTFSITSSGPERDKVTSYNVRIVKTTMPLESTATGNEKIAILKHHLRRISLTEFLDNRREVPAGVEFAIRNVSASTIATAVFEVVFYDIEGNIVEKVEHKEVDLKPNTSRAVIIFSSMLEVERIEVKSYAIRLTKTTTTDVEKVQLRGYQIRTTETGEEVKGIVKNISEAKTDAAVIVTFYDSKKEIIGTKVITLRDIEADSIEQFYFKFKPQEGDIVKTCAFDFGEIAG